MSFLKPVMLLGLLAAALPIIIHLIHRRRPRPLRFAAIELVLRSAERIQRRWRLKRILLLAMRVLLLAALAAAAAGPLLGSRRELAIARGGPKRLGIVIDASLSMRAKYGDSSAFQRAVSKARSLVDAMGPEDQAVLVAATQRPALLVPRPTGSKVELLRALDSLAVGYGTSELGLAVSTAVAALVPQSEPGAPVEGGPAMEARVVVLSDLAGHALQTAADLSQGSTGKSAALEVVDVLADAPTEGRANHALSAVEAVHVPGSAPRTIEVRARVQSFGEGAGPAQSAEISLRGPGGPLESGSVEIVRGTVVDKALAHAFEEPGFVPLEMALEPDRLAEDDLRWVMADVRRQVRSVVVDGAPSGVPKEDEVYYLDRALAAGAADQPPPRVITADDLAQLDLGSFDVVVLAGVSTFSRSEGSKLVEFVEKGGGLLISVSQDLDVELYNTELGRVLPRSLRAVKVADPEAGGIGADGLMTLRGPKLDHPVLEVFDPASLGGLLSARTRAYMLLDPAPGRPATVLASFEDGQPALIEGTAGHGRVMLLTTSIDRDLTDLPIRPAFVPLVRRLMLYLGGALAQPDPRRTLVGDPRELHAPPGTRRMVVIGPDGKESEVEVAATGVAAFDRTTLPGPYQVRAASTGPLIPLESEGFVVNCDPRESDLRPISAEEAAAILLGQSPSAGNAQAPVSARADALRGLASPETLAGALLLLMVLAFLVESALTAQRLGS